MTPALAREWRQFRRLVTLSFGRFLDATIASRSIEATQVVIWGGALLATPPLCVMVVRTSMYPWLRRAPERLAQAALADRLFFIVWTMLTATLAAALLWDALFPDRTDQQVVGVLPVRSRTVAAARLAAALMVGLGVSAAVSVPAAVGYAAFAAVDPIVGGVLAIMTGQILATMTAGVSTFAAVLVVRGLLTALVGAGWASRVALVVQGATVLALVEAFMFLPGLLPALLRPLLEPGATAGAPWPPVWFLGIYTGIAGPYAAQFGHLSAPAALAAVVALASAALVYLVPAGILARRATEPRRGGRADLASALGRHLPRILPSRPARAMARFAIVSLLRSPRHLMLLAAYVGAGAAVASTQWLSATLHQRPPRLDQPAALLVAIPLVFTFVLTGGLRAAFRTPIDEPANWTFRLASPRAPRACVAATRLVLWLGAVLPMSLLILAGGGTWWGGAAAVRVAAMHAASGGLLVELALVGWRTVPFTRAKAPSAVGIRVGLPLSLLGLFVFAYLLDDVQVWMLGIRWGTAAYVAVFAAAAVAARACDRLPTREPEVGFDAPFEPETLALNLSKASG